MTHQVSTRPLLGAADAGQRIAQMRHVLGLVERIAGRRPASRVEEAALDEAARVTSAYSAATTLAQRRFDAKAAETSSWAAKGIEALVAARDASEPPRAAARVLADELSAALEEMARILDA